MVKVKPLVWEYDTLEVDLWNDDRTQCTRVISSEHWISHPPHMVRDYGIVNITDPRMKRKVGFILNIGENDSPFDTLEAAKAAAQADYERRILSALEPPVQAEAAE